MRGGMELPAFLLLPSNNIQHNSSAYINILITYKQECRKTKSFELYQYYEFGTYLTVDKHTHVWLSALIKIKCKHTLGTSPWPKKHQHYKYSVPYLFPDPTSTNPYSPQPSPLFHKRSPSPLFFKHLVCILLWYMNICIYYKYIFYKEIWIQIQQKCDKPAMVKEGFESDHLIMNHNYCTATLSTVATGPIQIQTPLSWLLSFSINHLLMPCLHRNGRPVWSANSTEWRTCCFLRQGPH